MCIDDSLTFFDKNNDYNIVDLAELFSITPASYSLTEPFTITLLAVDTEWADLEGTAILAPSNALDLSANQIEISWKVFASATNTAPEFTSGYDDMSVTVNESATFSIGGYEDSEDTTDNLTISVKVNGSDLPEFLIFGSTQILITPTDNT